MREIIVRYAHVNQFHAADTFARLLGPRLGAPARIEFKPPHTDVVLVGPQGDFSVRTWGDARDLSVDAHMTHVDDLSPLIQVVRMPHLGDLPLPAYESAGAAGMDLRAAIEGTWVLAPGERALVPTGLSMAIPEGFEVQVRPRSGLAVKHGVTVLNTPGTVDSDYRGEIKVPLINHGEESFVVARGERIAQMIVAPVVQARLRVVAELGTTARGTGGFGSTGR